MLVMTLRGQRIAFRRNNLAAAPLTFIDSGVKRGGAGLMTGTKFRIGQVRQKVEVLVLRHLALAK